MNNFSSWRVTSGFSNKWYDTKIKTENVACFSNINRKLTKFFYITDFIRRDTEEYIETIIYYINQITPVTLETIKKKKYIIYKKIGVYYKDVLLLDFIRYLWYDTKALDRQKFFSFLAGKEKEQPTDKYKDPLEILLYAIQKYKSIDPYDHGNHNNIYHDTIIKSSKRLLEDKKFTRIDNFLKSKI